MRNLRTHVKVGLGLGLLLGVALTLALPGWAGRNSSGNYSLPAGNPVVPGTPISSTWANSTLADIATELTDSLDRKGRGGMLAPVRGADGTNSAPTYSFTSDTNTGLYRPAADSVALVLGGGASQTWTPAGSTLVGTLSMGSPLQVGTSTPITLRNVGSPVVGFNVVDTGSGATRITAGFAHDIAQAGADLLFRTAGTGAAGAVTMTTRASLSEAGFRIGANGSPVSASYAATYVIDFPSTAANLCNVSSQSMTGVGVGASCVVNTDFSFSGGSPTFFTCNVIAADTVEVVACNGAASTVDPPSQNFRVRVWQP